MKLNCSAFVSLYVLGATLTQGCSAMSLRGGSGVSNSDEPKYNVAAQLAKDPQMAPRVLSESDQCGIIELQPPKCTKKGTDIACEDIPLPAPDSVDCEVDVELRYRLRNQSRKDSLSIESFWSTRTNAKGMTDFLPSLQRNDKERINPRYTLTAKEYAKFNICEEQTHKIAFEVTGRISDAECKYSKEYKLVTPVKKADGSTTTTTQAAGKETNESTTTTHASKQVDGSTTTTKTTASTKQEPTKRCDLKTSLICFAPGAVPCKDYIPEEGMSKVSVTYLYTVENVGSGDVTLTSFETKRHGTKEELTLGTDLAPKEIKTIEREEEVDFSSESTRYRTNMRVAAKYDLGYGSGSCSATRSYWWM